jgi:hypothetical protein
MKNISQRAAFAGLVFGVIAVPAVVFASTAVFDDGAPSADVERTAAAAEITRNAVETAPPTADPARGSADVAAPADIHAACGAEGAELVAREASGEISELEQAALDALRPICAEAGLPLADPMTPEPVVIIETVMTIPVEPAPAPSVDDRDDEHEHEDDDDDRDEEDDDEHDEDDD